MITLKRKGDFKKLKQYLLKLNNNVKFKDLSIYGEQGVAALKIATPKDTGLTAASWYYEISKKDGISTIEFHNANIQNGVPIAIILQYGHATKNGFYISGVDYINSALRPLFEQIANDALKEVMK